MTLAVAPRLPLPWFGAGRPGRWRRVAGAWLGCLWAAGSAVAVPPPPEQIAADCERPVYASDHAVCADPALLALDRQMLDEVQRNDLDDVVARNALVESQPAWFRRRGLCAFSARHEACLSAAYRERIATLQTLSAAPDRLHSSATAFDCPGAPWSPAPAWLASPAPQVFVLTDAAGRHLAIGLDAEPGAAWTPFLRIGVRGAQVELQPVDGPSISCQPTDRPRPGGR